MLNPKEFYRRLDALLATIRIEKSDGNLLPNIVKTLVSNFKDTLQIDKGRIYERRASELVLVYPKLPAEESMYATRIPVDTPIIQMAITNRSYIYDQPPLNTAFYNSSKKTPDMCTAIWVHNQDKEWMLVFSLKEGWVREEISLFLNSVRTSINYRIFTELMEDRLAQAQEIQKSLLPKNKFQIEGYEIFGRSQPAEIVGGDFYDYFEYEKDFFGVALGDASGHGIPAALLVRDVVIGLRMGLAMEMRLVQTVKKLNTVIQKSTYSTNFVSMFIGEVEQDGHVFYINAGHPAPFLIKDKESVELPATGITLGFLPDIPLSRSHIHMPPSSILVMYSDGIIERTNEADRTVLGTNV
ncbi:MAG: SpoIIE family protein phosphatase [candidate division KSB1 bacterium]|nr:SpoIIE family protein phosphatase [candidate division KSB1 bacterium]